MVKVGYLIFIQNGSSTFQDFSPCLKSSGIELACQMGQQFLGSSQSILSALTISFLLFTRMDPVDGIVGFLGMVIANEAGKNLVLVVTARDRYAPDPLFGYSSVQKSSFERFSFLPRLWKDGNDSSLMTDNV